VAMRGKRGEREGEERRKKEKGWKKIIKCKFAIITQKGRYVTSFQFNPLI
jgi:hypothetical protein